jgi:hypothetical protein
LKGQRTDEIGETAVLVKVAEEIPNPEADDHHPQDQEAKPSFDVEAGGEPAHHPGVHA